MTIARAAFSLLATALLAACSSGTSERVTSTPAFYQRLDVGGRKLDPATSLSMINLYRSNNGAQPLVWDEAAAAVAQAAADRMANADKVLAESDIALPQALAGSGVRYKAYATNLSAGYRTFAEAFSGWREAKAQNAHMLDGRMSRIGLATAYKPGSKYQIFWVMVVVEPQG